MIINNKSLFIVVGIFVSDCKDNTFFSSDKTLGKKILQLSPKSPKKFQKIPQVFRFFSRILRFFSRKFSKNGDFSKNHYLCTVFQGYPKDIKNLITNRGSFETCVHVNGRSIKAKHKTFTKMEKIHQRAHDGLNIDWPKRLLIPGRLRYAQLVPLERTKGKPLYVDRNGRGYSCHVLKNLIDANTGERVFLLRRIYDRRLHNTDPKKLCNTGNFYREFRHHGSISVHHAVLMAWVGPCPKGYQADHLNGNNVDNRLVNLQWVTPSENQRRAVTLRRLRRLHEEFPKLYKDPEKMTRRELLNLFAQE